MHASKFGYVLLAVVAFSMPACFTADTSDDDDAGEGGESGETSGGSSGKGGSTSGSGGSTSGSGGSTSGSGGSSAGSSGSSGGGGACNLSGYELPPVECPAGSVTFLDDPTCLAYFSCLVRVGCMATGSDCEACVTYNEDSLSTTLMCSEGTTSGFAAACAQVSQDGAAEYPECVVGG
jgi:hypothetical protein